MERVQAKFGKPSHSISSSTERELLGSPLLTTIVFVSMAFQVSQSTSKKWWVGRVVMP